MKRLKYCSGLWMPTGKTEGQRSSSTRMKRMLGCGPDSVVPLANPRRLAILAPATAAVDFRKSLRFIVWSPMDEMRCCRERDHRGPGLKSVARGDYLCDGGI